MRELDSVIDPRIRLLVAFLWAVLFVTLSLGLWRRWPPVRPLFLLALVLYALYHLGLTAFFSQLPRVRESWPVDLAVYGLALLWTIWALYRPGNRTYWKKMRS